MIWHDVTEERKKEHKRTRGLKKIELTVMKNRNKNKYISFEYYSLFFKVVCYLIVFRARFFYSFCSCGFECNVPKVLIKLNEYSVGGFYTNKRTMDWLRYFFSKWKKIVTGVRLCIRGWRLNFMFPLFTCCFFFFKIHHLQYGIFIHSTHILTWQINYLKHVVFLSYYYLLFNETMLSPQ